MKAIRNIFLALALLGTVSCGNDWLELDPSTAVNTEEAVKTLGIPYEILRDGFRLFVPNTAAATELILRSPEIFADYEVTKGRMDDVFLQVTGKKLEGGAAK